MLGALFMLLDLFNFARGVRSIEGTIVGVQRELGTTSHRSNWRTARGRRLYTYRPVVEYKVDGRTYRFLAKVSASGYKGKVGKKVKVNYDPRNTSRGRLGGARELAFPGIIGACGLIAIILGLLAPSKNAATVEPS
ncbi:MAG: DUF3592 domain-containing protein [Deltaproteobacteria bacterium]|nr:DUF3592 domain-containing protein [Deltaproteobacteria bacterium]MBW1928435.1 DUF3592 domain-containing protein [Deltaproteobacteria bacterium]MBW2024230.1 DUF3592 domain-containing protein [Deltaproteobacteria bacterium]MBW2125065.1 DUF3592 domain-containing protein [Deltaproteobacteria bacterium]